MPPRDGARASAQSGRVTAAQVDAAMAAARVLAGVVAETMPVADPRVTAAQLRILVLVATAPGTNLTSVASAAGIHASNATRACDRLVRLGLLTRTDSAADRRNLSLTLTPEAVRLLDAVMAQRRGALTRILRRMDAADREALTPALRAFAEAAGEPRDDGRWRAG